MSRKIKTKVMVDDTIKFVFNHNNTHYTIRFAWKPLYILEQLYINMWWEDFQLVYDMLKEQPHNVSDKDKDIMKKAIDMTNTFLNCLYNIESPLVVYASDYKKELN